VFLDGRTEGTIVPHLVRNPETGKREPAPYSLRLAFETTFTPGGPKGPTGEFRPVFVNGWSLSDRKMQFRAAAGQSVILFHVEWKGKDAVVAFLDSDEMAGLVDVDIADPIFHDAEQLAILFSAAPYAWLKAAQVAEFLARYGKNEPVLCELVENTGYSMKGKGVITLAAA